MARDAALQLLIGGRDHAARVLRERVGKAFDLPSSRPYSPIVERCWPSVERGSLWVETLNEEPTRLMLIGEQVDRAIAAIGDFADLMSPPFLGHSSGVAQLAAAAATGRGLSGDEVVTVRRASWIHDLGRVAISTSIWDKLGPLTADEWERVRLHAYHTERVCARSSRMAEFASIAGAHHERLDGSGYHRGLPGSMLSRPARVLAVADAYHTMLEPRPHRVPLSPPEAAKVLADEAGAGHLDPDAVAAVLSAAGHAVPRMTRPAGLTTRKTEIIAMVARGLQTKQIAHRLGISAKTADHHLQNAYTKIGVSTRAAAALFAMQHGLTAWGELPITVTSRRF